MRFSPYERVSQSRLDELKRDSHSKEWMREDPDFSKSVQWLVISESFRRTIKRIQAEQTGKIAVSQ